MKPTVHVMSRRQVESPHFAPQGFHGFVSFFGPRDYPPQLPVNHRTLFVAQHAFDDVHGPGAGYRPMAYAQADDVARKVVAAVKGGHLEHIYIHCHEGISRSSACAAAIVEALTGSPGEFVVGQTYNPNPLVRRLMRHALAARAVSARRVR